MSVLGKRSFALDSQGLFQTQDEAMSVVPYKAQRKNVPKSRMVVRKSKVPRAIRTRGTPNGYYEIPTQQLIKIYVNTSSGMWNTDQTTGGNAGVTGYNGLGISSSLDNIYVTLGNGTTSATITQAWPGFAGLQGVFDECKIVDMSMDIWVANQVPNAVSATAPIGAPDLFLVYDPNEAIPPASQSEVLQYSSVKRVCFDTSQRTRMKVYPKLRFDLGTSTDGSGTTTTLSGSQNSCYLRADSPAAVHYGVRGWLNIPSASTSAFVYTINILVRQTRRYKVTK